MSAVVAIPGSHSKLDPSQLPRDKHKICRPERSINGHLESSSEYRTNYIQYPPATRVKHIPNSELQVVGGTFDSITEHQDLYVPHKPLPHPLNRTSAWVQNSGRFESVTTQRSDFPVWPNVCPPPPRERRKWYPSAGEFTSKTTNKTDFSDPGKQKRYIYKSPTHIPNGYKFDYLTSHQSDYIGNQKAERPALHRSNKFIRTPDNRDFQSTTKSAYKDVFPNQPVGDEFRASTTTEQAFQKWNLSPCDLERRETSVKTNIPFDSVTTYNDTFHPKTVKFKREESIYDKPQPPSNIQFDSTSTQRADYKFNELPEVFYQKQPKKVYVSANENREFVTSTQFNHGFKPLPHCDAGMIADMSRERETDGHWRVFKN
ncbi:hypothetical protein HK096_002989 [Nowakowskiella sp. JEL0078]|nr:hypothetical protein HK096_002989 [Nowakowskiella sp. JEL0078]